MAARLKRRHQEDIRAKIQVAQIINFLQTYMKTGLDTGKQQVAPARIQAAKILLDKAMSNAPTELSGPGGTPLQIEASWLQGRRVEG